MSSTLPDTADRVFRRVVAGNRLVGIVSTLPYWLARRDSAAMLAIARRFDSIARATPDEIDRGVATYAVHAAPAYLALLARDTATAVRRFEALPDSLCPLCYLDRMTLGHLLAARQEDRKAAALLDRWLIDLNLPSTVL